MKRHLLAALLSFTATPALADSVWVQAVADGYEARLVTTASVCPAMTTSKGEVAMTVRAPASADFPLVCSAPLSPGATDVHIGAIALPAPVAEPQRILVLGDTGCRIKGAALQACNDPAAWPFPPLAAAAAKLKPDLIVHVGDYLYRESACPAGNAGCAGSPWGDNWTTWQADFYTPAAPLLAAAPIVLVRGNHEDCTRAGFGWLRLQGPTVFDPTAPCMPHLPMYNVDVGGMKLAVMDDATAPETTLNRQSAPTYAAELAGMADSPKPVWFVHHRPIWAAVTGPLGIPIGGNLTLIEGTRINAQNGKSVMPSTVTLQLSGHIHSFEAINYDQAVAPQIVAGNGGDDLLITPRNLRGTQFQGRGGVTVADGLSVGGFGFLLMTKAAGGWTIDLYDQAGQAKGQCLFKDGAKPRVDCPGLKP
jgi:hypothetical protein